MCSSEGEVGGLVTRDMSSLRLVVKRCNWLMIVLKQPNEDAMVFISTCAAHHRLLNFKKMMKARNCSIFRIDANDIFV